MEQPLIGTRVRTKAVIDRFSDFCIKEIGLTGTVEMVSSEVISVKMDKHIPELDDWGNCLDWYDNNDTMKDFWDEMEIIPLKKKIKESQMIDNIEALVDQCAKDDLLDLYGYLFPHQKIIEEKVIWDLTDNEQGETEEEQGEPK
jgi:hypothetical protein